MCTNEQLREWDQRHYWHSFTPMGDYESLLIHRAEGATLYNVEGRAYLDAASSMWCNTIGHNHPRINAAITEQLGRVAHCTSLGMGADVTVRLAKRLTDLAPGDLEKVFFSSDGSSAIEIAMKQAFQYCQQAEYPQPAKTKFLCFQDAYHGDTIGATAVGGIGRYHEVFDPLLCEVVRVEPPDSRNVKESPSPPLGEGLGEGEGTLVHDSPPPLTPPPRGEGGLSPDHVCEAGLARVEKVLAEQADTIAAVIIEPLVQCAAGMLMHPPGFLAGLRELTHKYNVLLIADEVAVGFGKTGKLFACEHENVVPDFLCLAKGLTGGYLPMAVTLTTPQIYDAFINRSSDEDRTFWHGHTFSGNPLASAAAMACLDVLEEEKVIEGLTPKIAHLEKRLNDLASHPAVKNVRQCGLIGAFDLEASGTGFLDEESLGRRMARHALERGVWLRAKPDLIYVMPPLSITIAEMDKIMDVVTEAVSLVGS